MKIGDKVKVRWWNLAGQHGERRAEVVSTFVHDGQPQVTAFFLDGPEYGTYLTTSVAAAEVRWIWEV